MNTNPAPEDIALWLEDELPHPHAHQIETWIHTHQPELIIRRDTLRAYQSTIRTIIPAEIHPPYPDFFHSKLLKEISTPTRSNTEPTKTTSPWWKKLALPLTAATACALSFYLGSSWEKTAHPNETLVIYTPAEGVKAEYFETSPSEATVIVLNGLAPLDQPIPTTGAAASHPSPHNTENPLPAP